MYSVDVKLPVSAKAGAWQFVKYCGSIPVAEKDINRVKSLSRDNPEFRIRDTRTNKIIRSY